MNFNSEMNPRIASFGPVLEQDPLDHEWGLIILFLIWSTQWDEEKLYFLCNFEIDTVLAQLQEILLKRYISKVSKKLWTYPSLITAIVVPQL